MELAHKLLRGTVIHKSRCVWKNVEGHLCVSLKSVLMRDATQDLNSYQSKGWEARVVFTEQSLPWEWECCANMKISVAAWGTTILGLSTKHCVAEDVCLRTSCHNHCTMQCTILASCNGTAKCVRPALEVPLKKQALLCEPRYLCT